MELRNFVFSTQDLISGPPNQGCGIRVTVIETFHDVKSFLALKHRASINWSVRILRTVRINRIIKEGPLVVWSFIRIINTYYNMKDRKKEVKCVFGAVV